MGRKVLGRKRPTRSLKPRVVVVDCRALQKVQPLSTRLQETREAQTNMCLQASGMLLVVAKVTVRAKQICKHSRKHPCVSRISRKIAERVIYKISSRNLVV